MKKTLLLFSLGMIFLLVNSSCKKDEDPVNIDCSTITYSGTIKALVAANCSSSTCHGTGAPNDDYTSYDKIKDIATGDKMRTEVVDEKTMPRGGTLTAIEIAQVKCWLDAGAPDN